MPTDSWDELPDTHTRWRIKRIPLGDKFVQGKRYLTEGEKQELFDGQITIEEKLDGKQVAKVLATSMQPTPNRLILYGEWMRERHSILYDRLPSWFIAWGVYDETLSRMGDPQLTKAQVGWATPPVIYLGDGKRFLTNFSLAKVVNDGQSSFGSEKQEGIVVKNYEKQLFGKIVRQEFMTGIADEGHWIRRHGLKQRNRLAVTQRLS